MNHSDERINALEETAVKEATQETTTEITTEITTEFESLRFFQTQPHTCSYLADKEAKTIFLNPKQNIDTALYSELSEYGFRRSGEHIYKPLCANCNACIPMRIPVAYFKPKRQQRRTWKRNSDLTITQVKTIDTEEHYHLYRQYIETKHADGDMYPPSKEQFRSFLATKWPSSCYYEFRLDDRLVATSVADIMHNGISAVYSYYDTMEHKRSLGSFIILYLIERSKKYNLPSVYLGYWIKASSKMVYKSNYRPLEIQNGNQWVLVT